MAKVNQNKFLLLFVLFNLFTYCGFAQFDADKDNTFFGGLVAGGNFSQVDGDNFAGYHKAGWNVGGIVYAKLFDELAVSMELLYSQKGSRAGLSQVPKFANDQSTIITDYKIKLNYAEVPILLSYFDRRRSNFGGGFSYSQLIGSKETYTSADGTIYESDAKIFPFRKYDINFVLNGNAHIWKGFFVNLRFQYSLFSIRNAYNSLTGRDQQFNNMWCTRVMYIF